MALTAYTANLVAKAQCHGAAYQGPETVYLALVTDTPSKTVAGTEVTLGDYARVAFNQTTGFTDDDAGGLENTADIEYPEATADYDADVVAVEAYDDASAGNRLWFIVLATARTFVSGQTPKFLAGDLTLEWV
jgi:hypothetical protein